MNFMALLPKKKTKIAIEFHDDPLATIHFPLPSFLTLRNSAAQLNLANTMLRDGEKRITKNIYWTFHFTSDVLAESITFLNQTLQFCFHMLVLILPAPTIEKPKSRQSDDVPTKNAGGGSCDGSECINKSGFLFSRHFLVKTSFFSGTFLIQQQATTKKKSASIKCFMLCCFLSCFFLRKVSGWWLNQPIWKNMSQIGFIFPKYGVKIKNIWVATTKRFCASEMLCHCIYISHHLPHKSPPVRPPRDRVESPWSSQGFCLNWFSSLVVSTNQPIWKTYAQVKLGFNVHGFPHPKGVIHSEKNMDWNHLFYQFFFVSKKGQVFPLLSPLKTKKKKTWGSWRYKWPMKVEASKRLAPSWLDPKPKEAKRWYMIRFEAFRTLGSVVRTVFVGPKKKRNRPHPQENRDNTVVAALPVKTNGAMEPEKNTQHRFFWMGFVGWHFSPVKKNSWECVSVAQVAQGWGADTLSLEGSLLGRQTEGSMIDSYKVGPNIWRYKCPYTLAENTWVTGV